MPLAYIINPSQRLITITGEYADAEEWKSLLARVLNDPQRQPRFAFLRDLRDATTPVDAATVVRLMEVVRRFWPLLQPSRAAVLTPLEFDSAAMAAYAIADAEGIGKSPVRPCAKSQAWPRAVARQLQDGGAGLQHGIAHYKRFMNFLRKYDCQIPFKDYR